MFLSACTYRDYGQRDRRVVHVGLRLAKDGKLSFAVQLSLLGE
jgi:hypothetical protein